MNISEILFKEANKSSVNCKVACIIIYRNKIISIGYNKFITFNNILINYEPNKHTCHAEKDAILKVKNKSILKYCIIYIAKIKNGKIENAEPCIMCKKLLNKYKLINIKYI